VQINKNIKARKIHNASAGAQISSERGKKEKALVEKIKKREFASFSPLAATDWTPITEPKVARTPESKGFVLRVCYT
jgi:hypothetical protein